MLAPLRLVTPTWDTQLVRDILALEKLRYAPQDVPESHPQVFLQLRDLFQKLESVASARIEGNHTTLVDYVYSDRFGANDPERHREIANVERAVKFVEDSADRPLSEHFIRQLHQIVTEGLAPGQEGDRTPGQYRNTPVKISKSAHRPPELQSEVEAEMQALVAFATAAGQPHNDLLRTSIVHHRFMAIHPFSNGNGRTGRLVTYFMLLRFGFQVNGQVLNPTAVLCVNRDRYYTELGNADQGHDEGLLSWCSFFAASIQDELRSISRLADDAFVRDKLLRPSIADAFKRGRIDARDREMLEYLSYSFQTQNKELREYFEWSSVHASRMLKQWREMGLVNADPQNSRIYRFNMVDSPLLPAFVASLRREGFAVPADE